LKIRSVNCNYDLFMKIISNILIYTYMFFCISHVEASTAAVDNDADQLKSYVSNLITQGSNILGNNSLTEEDKVKKSADLIRDNLHLDWMAQYTLGRNKKTLSTQEIQKFIGVYSEFIVQAYAQLSKNYSGEKPVIKKVNKIDDNMFIVSLEILKKDSDTGVKVDYLVHKLENAKKSTYKIDDIITEGVSVLNSQKSEFNNIITNQGIDVLIDDLRAKLVTKH
jgi:phospholipid transport system substrate-binding protein